MAKCRHSKIDVKKGFTILGIVVVTVGKLITIFKEPTHDYLGSAGYSDAIKAVLNSGSGSTYESEIIKMVKKDATSDYYETVVSIMESGLAACHKRDAIKNISD